MPFFFCYTLFFTLNGNRSRKEGNLLPNNYENIVIKLSLGRKVLKFNLKMANFYSFDRSWARGMRTENESEKEKGNFQTNNCEWKE